VDNNNIKVYRSLTTNIMENTVKLIFKPINSSTNISQVLSEIKDVYKDKQEPMPKLTVSENYSSTPITSSLILEATNPIQLNKIFRTIKDGITEPIEQVKKDIVYKEIIIYDHMYTEVTDKSSNKHNKIRMVCVPISDNILNLIQNKTSIQTIEILINQLPSIYLRNLYLAAQCQIHGTRYIHQQKVRFLKELLKEKNLKQSGRKQELIDRLHNIGINICPEPDRVIRCGKNIVIANDIHSNITGQDKPYVGFSMIKDSIKSAFEWVMIEGPICNSKCQNMCFIINEILLYKEPRHHRSTQIIPMVRQAMMATIRGSKPRLMEPYYICNITCPVSQKGKISTLLANKEYDIIEEKEEINYHWIEYSIKIKISAKQTLYFDAKLDDQLDITYKLSDWKMLDSDPLDLDSDSGKIVSQVRVDNGLDSHLVTTC
jgi:translation elongation factor EF-G